VSTLDTSHQSEVASHGAQDSGQYFRYMAEFVGFTEADAAVIRTTRPLIEKHLPAIVGKFYAHVLRYAPTRKFFLKKDGTLDKEYLELRMRHLTNFWLRTAEGRFDDDYARYVDYVGRAHTARGADPSIYIPQRYVIGQVGMMQHAISEAISNELRHVDDETEFKAVEAWDKLMMVVLDLLSRAYGVEREPEGYAAPVEVDRAWVEDVAAGAVAKEHGARLPQPTQAVVVASAAEIPDGGRKIVELGGLSIGIFHHGGQWYALRNSCVHRGGPVATGSLKGDILVCPWHGFQFDVRDGVCVADPSARLDTYKVEVVDGHVVLHVPEEAATAAPAAPAPPPQQLPANAFRVDDVAPGRIKQLLVGAEEVAVYNVDGTFYATHNECTHAAGPLSESDLEGKVVTCFLHGSCFDVTTGAVLCGPATEPVKTYKVTVLDGIGTVEPQEG
jgi:nitrite reductase/ring-hydroxylating ferredoxin subunit/hemoglobin-like flavoprotein